MAKSFSDLNIEITNHILSNDKITVKSSKINSQLEKYVLQIITEILKKHEQEKFVEMLYTITKELAINGVKANQKRIFFEDQGLDITNSAEYAKGLALYKKKFSDSMANEYGKRCLSRGVYVMINFNYHEDGLIVEVTNNTPVLKEEESRMREKMRKAMGYNDIAEFYMDNMDNTEGAGLGIALIMILLKNENVDPNLFRIITGKERTIARVEIPFNENYTTIRSQEVLTLNGNQK